MYKLINDFQHTDSTGKIMVLKAGVLIERLEGINYIFKLNKKEYKINKNIVESNPDYFERIDFETILVDYLKKNSKRPYKKIAEGITELIEDEYIKEREIVDSSSLKIALQACLLMYQADQNRDWIKAIDSLGYDMDDNGELYKK